MKMMTKLILPACVLLIGSATFAQDSPDPAASPEAATRAERQARIKELRQLTQEDRQAHRREIQKRLENLSEEEKQALRERRQLRQSNRPQRRPRPSAAADDAAK